MPNNPLVMTFDDLRRCSKSERLSRDAVFRMKWADGFQCPKCPSKECRYIPKRPKVVECRGCHRQETLTSGTFLHGTRKDLRHWFKALLFVLSTKTRVSATALRKHLGFPTYQTAWIWLRRIHALIESMEWANQMDLALSRKLGKTSARTAWSRRRPSYSAWSNRAKEGRASSTHRARDVFFALLDSLPHKVKLRSSVKSRNPRLSPRGMMSLKYFSGHFFGWLFPCLINLDQATSLLFSAMAGGKPEPWWRLIGRKDANSPLLVSPL